MSLFTTCAYCQKNLPKRLVEKHVCAERQRVMAAAAKESKKKSGSGPSVAIAKGGGPSRNSKSNVPFNRTTAATKPVEESLASSSSFELRLRLARKEQKLRSEKQARRNQEIESALTRPRGVTSMSGTTAPILDSKWKEQLGKLRELHFISKASSYSLQLQSVPIREIPAPVDRRCTPDTAARKKVEKKNAVVSVSCSCEGLNDRCFRCSGTGYYDVSSADAEKMRVITSSVPKVAMRLSDFASDARGSEWNIREKGRFNSAPLHDDYQDDSSS